jgi:hypothetical protein
MSNLKNLTQSENLITKRAFSPTDGFDLTYGILSRYSMQHDGFEIGHPESGTGSYPAYFWATRDGIRGRDFQR